MKKPRKSYHQGSDLYACAISSADLPLPPAGSTKSLLALRPSRPPGRPFKPVGADAAVPGRVSKDLTVDADLFPDHRCKCLIQKDYQAILVSWHRACFKQAKDGVRRFRNHAHSGPGPQSQIVKSIQERPT